MLIINENDSLKVNTRFICSPTVEMVSSLHVLAEPSHHTSSKDWSKGVIERISPQLKSEIDFFADNFAQWSLIMDIVCSVEQGVACQVVDFLDRLQKLPLEEFSFWFFSGLIERDRIQTLMEDAEALDYKDMEKMQHFLPKYSVLMYLKNAENIRVRLINVLKWYWNDIFKDEWNKISLYEIECLESQNKILLDIGWKKYLETCHEDIVINHDTILLRKQTNFEIRIDDVREVIIIPSVFTHPHLMMSLHGNCLTVYKNMEFVETGEITVPKEMDTFLKAINSSMRLKILKVISTIPKTTKDLSEIFNLNPSTVSEHLKVMKEAGLIDSERKKNLVYYHLNYDEYKRHAEYISTFLDS